VAERPQDKSRVIHFGSCGTLAIQGNRVRSTAGKLARELQFRMVIPP